MSSRMSAWFTERVSIYRRKAETGWVAAGYELAGKIKAFIQPGGGTMGTTSGAVMPNATYDMFCEVAADVRRGDKVVDSFGRTYVVMSVPRDRGVSGIMDHLECAMELQNA